MASDYQPKRRDEVIVHFRTHDERGYVTGERWSGRWGVFLYAHLATAFVPAAWLERTDEGA